MKTKKLLFLVLALITALGSCMAMFESSDDPLEVYGNADWHVVSLSIFRLPDKMAYTVGESPDWSGLVVRKTFSDGRTNDIRWGDSINSFEYFEYYGYEISGFNSSSPGMQTITVSKKGKSATFTVTVM